MGGQEQVDWRAQGGCRQFSVCPVEMKSSASARAETENIRLIIECVARIDLKYSAC